MLCQKGRDLHRIWAWEDSNANRIADALSSWPPQDQQRLIHSSKALARKILRENWPEVEAGVQALLDRETLDGWPE